MKERWNDFVGSHRGYTSVSGLIRGSVEKNIALEREEGVDAPGRDVEELVDEFDDIRSHLGTLEDKLDLVRLEARDDSEVRELVVSGSEEMNEKYALEIIETIREDNYYGNYI